MGLCRPWQIPSAGVLYGTLSPVPAPLHNFFFVSCLARKMFTLRNYELWTNVERTDLPAYLKRKCPLGSLREGRRLKTKLRLGCHPLRSSAARMSLTRNAACPCCGHGSETIVHTIFECHGPKLDDVRYLYLLCDSDLVVIHYTLVPVCVFGSSKSSCNLTS